MHGAVGGEGIKRGPSPDLKPHGKDAVRRGLARSDVTGSRSFVEQEEEAVLPWGIYLVVTGKALRPAGRKLDHLGQRKGWTTRLPRAFPPLKLILGQS